MDDSSLTKFLIGAARVKYSVLDSIYAPINYRQYNMAVMYVDAHSIMYRLYRYRNLSTIYAADMDTLVKDIVVGFFNVLGHYRRYMATRFRLDNDIFVMFNTKPAKYNCNLVPTFNSKLYAKYSNTDPDYGFTNKALKRAYQFIIDLSSRFEGIYCIDNSEIDDIALMEKLGFREDNLYTIFSKSMFATQLLRPNVVQLVNRRDDSYLITEGNCYRMGILRRLKTQADERLTPDMLPLIWMLGGCRDVSIDHLVYIPNVSYAVKILNRMCECDDITSGISMRSFLENFKKYIPLGNARVEIDYPILENRYKAVSAKLAAAAITTDQMARVEQCCYDVYNENELEQLNDILATGTDPQLLDIENLNMSNGVRYE